jgi:hypothetical protein
MSAYGDVLEFDQHGKATDSQGHVYEKKESSVVRVY